MAPQGTKRGSKTSPPVPKKARREVVPKDPVVLQCELLAAELSSAPLPEHVVQLLVAMLPKSLGVSADQRHSTQAAVVDMIGGAFADMEQRALAVVETKHAEVDACTLEHARLEKDLAAAEAAFEAQSSAAAGKGEALQAARAALSAARETLAQRVAAERSVGEELSTVTQQVQALAAAMQEYTSVKEGSAPPTKAAFAAIEQAGKSCNCDLTMLAALPAALSKTTEQRSSFDSMTLQCFEEAVSKHQTGLDADAASLSGPAKAERAAAVTEAEAARDCACAANDLSTEAHAAALEAQESSKLALREARDATGAAEAKLSEAQTALSEARGKVETFRLGVLSTFTTMKERTTPQPEPESKIVEEAVPEMAPAADTTPIM